MFVVLLNVEDLIKRNEKLNVQIDGNYRKSCEKE